MKTINYGIDLGTSNSCIAFATEGRAEIFRDTESKDIIASAVMFDKGGRVQLVGNDAYNSYPRRPERVFIRFKRAMGTNTTFTVEGAAKPLRPEDLSAEVLKELKRLASLRGHSVEHAVICTPAMFDSAQVAATNEAAILAGIANPVLLAEPMAASYGYGLTTEKQGAWLVYDLGAGTFDAVVVQVRDGKMTILNIDGTNRQGGSDMDRIIWEEVIVPQIAKEAGIPITHLAFKKFRNGGIFVTERAKICLSKIKEAVVPTDEIRWKNDQFCIEGERVEIEVQLTRSQIEAKIEPLVDRTLEVCRRMLASFKQVAEVLLVGGPTVMPIVREKLKTLGVPINTDIDPMTAVATGAALYASMTPVQQSRPASISATPGKPSTGKLMLQLDYEPTSEDTETPLVVRCTDSRAGFVIIERGAGNWTSGRIPLSEGGHVLTLPLESRRMNAFKVTAHTATGAFLECEPCEISIFQASLVAAPPPLPESFWLETQNPDDENEIVSTEIIKKGTPLPAKATQTVRTTVELARGSANEVVLKIWEGNRKYLRANRYALAIVLTGHSVSRKLPANTEIQVTVSVDAGRIISAEAYIPIADESLTLEKRDDRTDTSNPFQLEQKRKALADQIETLEQENDNQEVKVSLEVCRRLIFSQEVTKALKLAKEGDPHSADAFVRADDSLREAEDRLVGLREKNKECIIPNEWRWELERTKAVVNSQMANESDRQHFEAIGSEGEASLDRKRLNALRRATQEMCGLRIRILARHLDFWHELASGLPPDARAYTNPDEAQRILRHLPRAQGLEDVRTDVLRLYGLLPKGTIGGDAEAAVNIIAG